ncbi:MAG: alpha/beta hydrolase [Streptococcus sp.]|nr:alpha/beta hydrolase [Streptococcus sp.]
MIIKEYGKENIDIILLIHGGGLSWWNYKEEAEILGKKYHVVLPILDGHAESDKDFVDIKTNAIEIISYIDNHYNGKVLAICGLSLGAQILIDILSMRTQICQYAIIESALIEKMPLLNFLVKPLINISYWMISNTWFAKAQFKLLNIQENLFKDYYKDSCAISKNSMIAFLKSNLKYEVRDNIRKSEVKVLILVGSKEQKKMILSAKKLNLIIPYSSLRILKGYTHGDISLNHPQEYVEILLDLIKYG